MRAKNALVLLAATLCIGSPVSACLGPTNVEGVAFTNSEKLDFESLSALGTDGVNYKTILSDKGGTAVTYPCHYNSKAMTFIGTMGVMHQQNIMINCFGIIYPLSEEMMSSHAAITKEVFDFPAAVKSELDWLSAHKIVTLTSTAIDSIVESLKKAGNGGLQYWTLQKNALGYNSWYTYDTISGVWGGGGMDGVNSVKSVRGVNGCSGVEIPAFEVLQPVTVKEMGQRTEKRDVRITILGNTLKIKGLQSNETIDIKVVSITGKIIRSFTVKSTPSHQVELGNFVAGTYLIRLSASGTTINKSVVIH